MKNLLDWYWIHGIKRGQDVSDPDRELRKISIGSWFDPVSRIVDRDMAINSNIDTRACLALWGPSQTGKSTMMSRYIDGECLDGSDSALTWTPSHKSRFSPPAGGVNELPAGTLVFNPFNHNSDASGIATRYTLKSESSGEVNPEYPIELKLTTRAQLIQSLSLGYLSECEKNGLSEFTCSTFQNEIPDDSGRDGASHREAYSVLKDTANVIEFMKGHARFGQLFRNDEWKKIRRRLVSSGELLKNPDNAESFMAKIFWNEEAALTDFYNKAENLRKQLTLEWQGCKILSSMEVGALLLDIDSFKSYLTPDSDQGRKVQEKVMQLAYEKVGDEVHVFLKPGGSLISGEQFGYFQAICAELLVPMKKENLNATKAKSPFLKLAEKCDFLDFPGVSNKNRGDVGGSKIDLSNPNSYSDADIFTKVFKQGKTQCFVYNYVEKFGIDAFAVLMRTDRFPSKSGLLDDGIKAWIHSFDPGWLPNHSTEMPLFVNLTFFANLLNNIALNGVGKGLSQVLDRIQEDLSFARKESAHFFVTTYPQFPDGRIDSEAIAKQSSVVQDILNDPALAPKLGLSEDGINAVFEPDGGVDYMFSDITQIINSVKRKTKSQRILEQDKEELKQLIRNHLPSDSDSQAEANKRVLAECLLRANDCLKKIEEDEETERYVEFAQSIKSLFSASAEDFDPIPEIAHNMSKKEIKAFIEKQIAIWYEKKMPELTSDDFFTLEQKQHILRTLRDNIDKEALFKVINNNLGELKGKEIRKTAQYSFALIFGNLLKTGCATIISRSAEGERNPEQLDRFIDATIEKNPDRMDSPYYHAMIEPALIRIKDLAERSLVGVRPPQPGDDELQVILAALETSQIFSMN